MRQAPTRDVPAPSHCDTSLTAFWTWGASSCGQRSSGAEQQREALSASASSSSHSENPSDCRCSRPTSTPTTHPLTLTTLACALHNQLIITHNHIIRDLPVHGRSSSFPQRLSDPFFLWSPLPHPPILPHTLFQAPRFPGSVPGSRGVHLRQRQRRRAFQSCNRRSDRRERARARPGGFWLPPAPDRPNSQRRPLARRNLASSPLVIQARCRLPPQIFGTPPCLCRGPVSPCGFLASPRTLSDRLPSIALLQHPQHPHPTTPRSSRPHADHEHRSCHGPLARPPRQAVVRLRTPSPDHKYIHNLANRPEDSTRAPASAASACSLRSPE